MRLAQHAGRAVLMTTDSVGVDVARASSGRYGPDLTRVYADWPAFVAWAEQALAGAEPDVDVDPALLGPPSPHPSQVLAVGLNYAEHARETGYAVPDGLPPVFTKFPSALTGPYGTVALPSGGSTDWEVEVVAVVGRAMHRVAQDEVPEHLAGLTVGQDLSERQLQLSGEAPQFSLGKSYPGFAPVGPWLVTLDELPALDDLRLGCAVDDEVVQDGHTSHLLLSIPQVVSRLSQVVTLRPGDLVFTGTPDGVGMGRTPARFLRPGQTLRTWVDGIGEMRHTFVADPAEPRLPAEPVS